MTGTQLYKYQVDNGLARVLCYGLLGRVYTLRVCAMQTISRVGNLFVALVLLVGLIVCMFGGMLATVALALTILVIMLVVQVKSMLTYSVSRAFDESIA